MKRVVIVLFTSMLKTIHKLKKYFKTTLLLLVLCLLVTNLHGQNEKKNMVGIHAALGTGVCGIPSPGAGNYDVKYYISTGLDYAKQLSKRWDFLSGLEYTYSRMIVSPEYSTEPRSRIENLTLVTIPVQFKYHFGKIVYFNGGMFLNIINRTKSETWVQSHAGVSKLTHNAGLLFGCGLGVGFEHEMSNGILFYLNPYVRLNGFGGIIQKGADLFLLQGGACLGVGYKF